MRRNAAALGAALSARGMALATGGTDNHLVLWDVRPLGLTGGKMEKLLEVRPALIAFPPPIFFQDEERGRGGGGQLTLGGGRRRHPSALVRA